jgi:hypothetical protein
MANLPAAESAYTGVDSRPRWVATAANPACATAGQAGPCVTRLNNAVGDQVTAAYVIKNQSQNRSWDIALSLSKPVRHGFSFKGGFNYGVSRSVVEPSSTAGSSWGGSNPILSNPSADANGALAYTYNPATVLNGNLLTTPLQTSAGINDVYVMMLSFN